MNEIKFISVKDAVRWSEEVATLPDVKSQLGSLLSKRSTGNLNRFEVVDIARTITAITASSKPWKGMTMRVVLGDYDNSEVRDLAIVIVAKLRSSLPEISNEKQLCQLIGLGISVLKSTRFSELHGKKYSSTKMADDIGISRESLSKAKGWRRLRAEAEFIVREWIRMAETEIHPQLIDRGWL